MSAPRFGATARARRVTSGRRAGLARREAEARAWTRIADYFKFAERGTNLGTEARAGVTTFMVMAYIIFLNPIIIAGPLGLDPVAVAPARR